MSVCENCKGHSGLVYVVALIAFWPAAVLLALDDSKKKKTCDCRKVADVPTKLSVELPPAAYRPVANVSVKKRAFGSFLRGGL